jgi:betaine-aldehyde dehydrogenase
MKAQPVASHFVDGAYLEDKAGAPIEVVYPATGEVIAVVHEATAAVVERALASAKRAQADWAVMKPVERARILRRAAEIIRDRG